MKKKPGRKPKFGEPLLHPSIGITQVQYDFIDKQPHNDFAAKHRAVIDAAMNAVAAIEFSLKCE